MSENAILSCCRKDANILACHDPSRWTDPISDLARRAIGLLDGQPTKCQETGPYGRCTDETGMIGFVENWRPSGDETDNWQFVISLEKRDF